MRNNSKTEYHKKQQEQRREQQDRYEFNSITQKTEPENQNQQHNVRREGILPVNQKR